MVTLKKRALLHSQQRLHTEAQRVVACIFQHCQVTDTVTQKLPDVLGHRVCEKRTQQCFVAEQTCFFLQFIVSFRASFFRKHAKPHRNSAEHSRSFFLRFHSSFDNSSAQHANRLLQLITIVFYYSQRTKPPPTEQSSVVTLAFHHHRSTP